MVCRETWCVAFRGKSDRLRPAILIRRPAELEFLFDVGLQNRFTHLRWPTAPLPPFLGHLMGFSGAIAVATHVSFQLTRERAAASSQQVGDLRF
jgi:hypothetical protein